MADEHATKRRIPLTILVSQKVLDTLAWLGEPNSVPIETVAESLLEHALVEEYNEELAHRG